MKSGRPTADQERWLALVARFPQLHRTVHDAALSGDWRRATLLTRALLFALGLVAAGCVWTVVDLLGVPQRGLFAGGVLLVASEWLVRVRRLHASGIEEALWAGGAVMCALQITEIVAIAGDTDSVLAAALALAFAGWRLANPLLTTLAALLVSGAIAMASRTMLAGLACFIAAAAALAAGSRTFVRPSTDRMCDGLVLLMPAAGGFWMMWNSRSLLIIAALLAVLLCLGFLVGWRRRRHPPLMAAVSCTVLLLVVLHDLSDARLYLWLLMWGSIAIAAAELAEHLLRDSRSGVVAHATDPSQDGEALLHAVVISSATSATAAEPAVRSTPVQGQGGDFGGGGASGRF